MNEMVDRVADALMTVHSGWRGNEPTGYIIPDRATALVLAKLAISTMYVPTEQMLGQHHKPTAEVIWRCMVEAALK